MKKKVLLLTASYGSGHLTANKSVNDALLSLYPEEIETKTIDFLNVKGYISTGDLFRRIYNWTMENPLMWDIIFHFTDSPASQNYFRLIFPLFYGSLYRIFEEEKPDIFVVTHPYWNYIIDVYRRKYNRDIPCVTIVTDSTAVHHTWVGPGVDYYLVNDRETYNELKVLGVDQRKIIEKGFPVSPEFGKEFDRAQFLSGMGLDPELLTVLIVVGLGAFKRFTKVVDLLRSRKELAFQLIITTGKYKSVYRVLQSKEFSVRTKIVGWTDRMPDFIRASDLVIAKGGGAIVMETLSAGRPIFIPVITPGQERGNAQLIMKHDLGFVETSLRKIDAILSDVISNPGKIRDLQKRAAAHRKPGACFDIAKFIHSLIFKPASKQ